MKAGMCKPYVLCLWIFALVAGNSLQAQKLLTIDEAIATALKNNHDITLAKYDSASAAIDYSFKGAALHIASAPMQIAFHR